MYEKKLPVNRETFLFCYESKTACEQGDKPHNFHFNVLFYNEGKTVCEQGYQNNNLHLNLLSYNENKTYGYDNYSFS